MKTCTRTADGSPVDEFTATMPNGILRDGCTLRTKMFVMDSDPSGAFKTPVDNPAAREAPGSADGTFVEGVRTILLRR